MGKITFKEMDIDDIDLMSGALRQIDATEFRVMSGGKSHIDNLTHLLNSSRRSRAAYYDGELLAVYGVISPTILNLEGNPWMAATDLIDRPDVRRAFIEETHEQFAWATDGFKTLWNVVSKENKVAIRWLKWMGFLFDGSEYVISGHKFVKFEMEI